MSTLTLKGIRAGGFGARMKALLLAGPALRRQRAQLAALDDHLLQDIGITRAEAIAEANRPVWPAPAHWVQ